MTTRRVRRTIRSSGNGINVAVDVNAVVATGGGGTSSSTVTVTQANGTTRRTTRAAGDGTRGEQ